eukprot:CAMPEP_0197182208 /NCGR_PEP_ID=MMETSP1423-20130617/6245_1 /TAXON_ID=476441 /ORGANISM="Pseudo-nitzschia heimii, Strain UNC1101" /LENGTH=359 /DNA_ID=CAMNT_0042632597 /DNA_START=97 /DNA_END=1176 /DNA_ORIENTATION=+
MEWSSNAFANPGKDDTTVFYQIDCQTTKKGKLIAGTKRRICWKFGFSSHDAMRNGRSGADCRGEEHEVVFVWSLTSGKKFVLVDGHEVHWSKQSPISEKFDGTWECSWQSRMGGANRELKVVSQASSPRLERKSTAKNSRVADSSFRKFDLLVDGISFSDMCQMFELGFTKVVGEERRISMGDVDSLWGVNQQQLIRTDIHDIDSDALSRYSFQPHVKSILSENHQHPNQKWQQAPLTTSAESLSESMPDLQYDFSTSPTSVVVGGGSTSHSNYHFAQNQQQRQHPVQMPFQMPEQLSSTTVTEVTSGNPFDQYATATFKPHEYQQQQQQQQQQIHTQFENGYYARQGQQNQEPLLTKY